jgi:hypothetical protein
MILSRYTETWKTMSILLKYSKRQGSPKNDTLLKFSSIYARHYIYEFSTQEFSLHKNYKQPSDTLGNVN